MSDILVERITGTDLRTMTILAYFLKKQTILRSHFYLNSIIYHFYKRLLHKKNYFII